VNVEKVIHTGSLLYLDRATARTHQMALSSRMEGRQAERKTMKEREVKDMSTRLA